MSKRIAFTVTGKVQGVCYRSFAVDSASSLNLSGNVRNASDGTVIGEAQGDSSSLDKFVAELRKGPSAARVKDVDVKDVESKSGEIEFSQK